MSALADLTLSGGLPGASPVLMFIGFAPAALPFDGGTLLATPTFTVSLPPLNGAGSISIPIPIALDTTPAGCGVHLYFQAIFADPGAAGFYHSAQTNGLDWTIGS